MAAFHCIAVLAVLLCLTPNVGRAEILTLNALDQGGYQQTATEAGWHCAGGQTYLAGRYIANYIVGTYRNYFVFDLSGITKHLIGAKLVLNSQKIVGGDETLQLYSVDTDIDRLIQGGRGNGDIFADLGAGTVYGSGLITGSKPFAPVEIPLNANFLSVMNANHGKLALGGALTTLTPGSPSDQYVFGYDSGYGVPAVQLVLQTNPEPSTVVLLVAGAIVVVVSRGLRRTRMS
jgi:hypothetical protein